MTAAAEIREAPRPPAPGEFAERAAILEHDGGLRRHEAERHALREAGFASAEVWARALCADWRALALLARPRSAAGRQAVSDALAMLEAFGPALPLAGWDEADLFGVASGGSEAHGVALRLKGGRLLSVRPEGLAYVAGGYGARGVMRSGEALGARPFWEV